jgi:DNA (cytosine-5)-methyltransferase 1
MAKIKLLDLCCGAGGCSMGYKLAAERLGMEIEITGVDMKVQKNYPFEFVREDAMSFLGREGRGFTHIHASPPCQEFLYNSNAKADAKVDGHKGLLLLLEMRVMMYSIGLPGVIENVIGSPLIKDIVLEGRMFGLKVIRRRVFETVNWFMLKPGVPMYKSGMVLRGECMSVTGHGSYKNNRGIKWLVEGEKVLDKRRNAMGIDWMTDREITQAIPPAYTKYIGMEFFKILK